jgi:hypothetical protein
MPWRSMLDLLIYDRSSSMLCFILGLWILAMSFDTWHDIDVFWWILVLLMCISLHFYYILYIFVLYTMYFYCILEKNTNRKYTSGAPIGCATDIMRGAPFLGAPWIGHLIMAHVVIRPKRIYFLEYFCYYFSSNLCVLNSTNTDWRCFQQNCSGVSFLCRNPTLSKNLGKIMKNPISPEDPWSQKIGGRRGLRGHHTVVARPSPDHDTPAWGGPRTPLDLPSRVHIPPGDIILGRGRFSQIDFHCAATIRNRDSKPETPFWHHAGTGIRRRSSPPSSLTLLHQPSMTPPSMCE